MMQTATIIGIITALGWLILNWRALQSHGLSGQRKFAFALAWVIIIAGLTLILQHLGASLPR